MTSFLKQVEAYVRKDGTVVNKQDKTLHKPKKAKKAKKLRGKGLIAPFKPAKNNKPFKPRKFDGPATAADNKSLPASRKASTNFAHVRALMAQFDKEMQVTDPFDLSDNSWIKFLKNFAPQLLVSLLWDTKNVTLPKDRAELLKFFKQHIRI